MKKIFITSFLVLAVGIAIALTGVAQNAAHAPVPVRSSVAVVDIGKILTEWKWVAGRKAELEKEFKPKVDAINAREEALQKQVVELKTLKRGDDYSQKEDALIRQGQALQTEKALLQKQADEKNAKILQDAYKYIKEHSKYHAQRIGATCVIQINSAEEFQLYNPNVPATTLTTREVFARNVIWYENAINVTDQVLTGLNAGAQQSNSARTTTTR